VVVKELLRGYRLNGRVARASRVLVGEYGTAPAAPREPEPLIGADEVPPGARGLDPGALGEAPEPSLEELIARVQGKPDPDLPGPVSEGSQEPALLSEADFALGPLVEEPAPRKPRRKPRG
jgi:hypothetical protein